MRKIHFALLLTLLLATALCLDIAVQKKPRADLVETQSQQAPNDEFMTPLKRAAWDGRVDEVRRLLRAGADVNEKSVELDPTPLMVAAGRGQLEVVKVLLEAGADPNAADGVAHVGFFSVLTIAMNARNKNRLEVIDTLIASGAKLNPPSWFPESPLMRAVIDHDIEMIKALLQRGSDVNWENAIGNTALVTAIDRAEPHVDVVKLLLDAGADPNTPRLWSGNDCVSILQSLDDAQKRSRDKVTKQIRELIIQAGGKRYKKRSHGEPCKPEGSNVINE